MAAICPYCNTHCPDGVTQCPVCLRYFIAPPVVPPPPGTYNTAPAGAQAAWQAPPPVPGQARPGYLPLAPAQYPLPGAYPGYNAPGVPTGLVQYYAPLTVNAFGLVSFILCMLAIVLAAFEQLLFVGPLLAIVFGGIGIATYNRQKHSNRWMAFTGVVVGVILLLASVVLAIF